MSKANSLILALASGKLILKWDLFELGMSTDGAPSATDTILQYNSLGYPIQIKSLQGYNVTLNYSCH
jgi:hypothetical protein